MRKKTKKDKRRILFSFVICCFLAAYLCVTTVEAWSRIISNRSVEKGLKKRHKELLKTEENLRSEIIKLEDPDYAAKYAREKYLISKEGEIIFKIVK